MWPGNKRKHLLASPAKRTELVHEEPRKLHEEHDVGEDKFAFLQRLMKNLCQI